VAPVMIATLLFNNFIEKKICFYLRMIKGLHL